MPFAKTFAGNRNIDEFQENRLGVEAGPGNKRCDNVTQLMLVGFYSDARFRIPSFFIRETSVVGLRPKSSAAPPGP